MAKEQESPENQDLTSLRDFAKMVRKQLKKVYGIDVGRLTKKIDLHGQPKAVLKIGPKDDKIELWFRYGDNKITIDKVVGGKADGIINIEKPICHLRTSAKLVDEFNLPEADVESNEEDKVVSHVASVSGGNRDDIRSDLYDDPMAFLDKYGDSVGDEFRESLKKLSLSINEENEVIGEAEDFEEEFSAPSRKFAIVDASVVESIADNELAQKAIIVPIKHPGAVFDVSAEYDDTILRNLTIKPSEIDQDGTSVVKTTDNALDEGIAPLSHESQIDVRTRNTIKSRHKAKGRDVPAQIPDPTQVTPRRDKSKSDERYKKRKAERPSQVKKAERMRSESSYTNIVISLLEGKNEVLDELDIESLQFVANTIDRLRGREDLGIESLVSARFAVSEALKNRGAKEVEEIVRLVECIRTKKLKTIS